MRHLLHLHCLLPSLLLPGVCQAEAIRACAQDVDTPPFIYRSQQSQQLRGYTLDVLQRLLQEQGHQLQKIDRLPWRRCVSQLQLGVYQLALDARTGQFEGGQLLATQPYYQLHNLYFYSRKRFPKGLRIASLGELNAYRLCSLAGQGYESFGIDTRQVDSGTNNYGALIGKLHTLRCDLFIEAREIVAGHLLLDATLGDKLRHPNLDEAPLPGDKANTGLHLLVGHEIDRRLGLLQSLNDGIGTLRNNGSLAKMMFEYLR